MNKNIWTVDKIRSTWLNYFKDNDHLIVESKSLIPVNDNSLLWINSGVATLKEYFSGQKNPPYKNLTNSQKCIRTNDIYNVGVTSRHQTFFEMLGNFSIGSYFKVEAINLAYNLLTKHFNFTLDKLYITVYEDDNIAYETWLKCGIIKEHIVKCNRDRNFWDVGSGPCGPCTEIYYDRGSKYDPDNIGEKLFFEDIENDRYVEIWNIVFSEFNNIDGKYIPLTRKNIDTGAGIERLACILQDVPTNFDIDTFQIIINEIQKHAPKNKQYVAQAYFDNNEEQNEINRYYKIIADHMRALVFALSDGATISNKDRGYILKRLLRRVIINQYKLDINKNVFEDLVNSVIISMQEYYPYLKDKKERVLKIINKEFDLFNKTLIKGKELFEKFLNEHKLDKHAIFKLVETYGLPIELIESFAKSKNVDLDLDGFDELFKHHQQISNANNINKAMINQNGELLNLNVESKFLYETYELNAKVVALFDEQFNKVNELSENGYVVFNQTCFYATSGGQLHDTGLINDDIIVDNVFKGPNLQHIHHINNINHKTLKLNENCHLKIDVNRRQKLMKNHSVEHLIHAALVKFLDNNIKQEGAFKSPEKVTFDFQLDSKPSKEQLNQIENYINDIIKNSIEVNVLNLTLDEAKQIGAKAYFEDVYKKIKGTLRVIKIGNESIELCGGTHVNNTKDIELFKIVNCSPKGAGSWRIEAITSYDTINKYFADQLNKLKQNANLIDDQINKNNDLYDKDLVKLINQINNAKEYNDEIVNLSNQLNDLFTKIKINANKQNNKHQLIEIKQKFISNLKDTYDICEFISYDNKIIFNALTELINEHQNNIFVALNIVDDKLQYLIASNEKYVKENNINLNNLIKEFNKLNNGKGGGKPNFVQGGCSIENLDQHKINELINQIKKLCVN